MQTAHLLKSDQFPTQAYRRLRERFPGQLLCDESAFLGAISRIQVSVFTVELTRVRIYHNLNVRTLAISRTA
jgi:hypothetical protein